MPSPLKRPSLGRLLAALRSPTRVPVQTGFPTSLADLVLKNHGRLRKPRKLHRPTALALPPSPAENPVDVAETPSPPPSPEPPSPVLVEDSSAPVVRVRRLDAPKGAAFFRPRPELLALGGAVALALLAVWREGTVAAFTIASLSLLWIESASRRRRPPAKLRDSRGRAPVSPIREAEEAPGCSASDRGSEAPSPRPSERRELVSSGGEDPATPKRKARRSLRKIISKTLQKKKPKAKDASGCSDGEVEQPDGAEPVRTEAFLILAPCFAEQTPSEPSTESSVEMERRGGGFPLAAFVPVILAGLAAGRLPATALAVLCVAFFGLRRRASLGCQRCAEREWPSIHQ